jgi:hypothetical protein
MRWPIIYGADPIGGQMRLSVADTGVGIASECQACERFESTTKSKHSRRAGSPHRRRKACSFLNAGGVSGNFSWN